MGTIFWSWQSDLDPRVTRDLIRDALAAAIAELQETLEERHELTSDTKGVAGSPDIVATILAKIDAAAVFVGDVTPIAVSTDGKAVANPNVLIELGYAKRAIGLNRILLVWNTAFPGAAIDKLPFDMRGRRAPVGFHLPAGSTRAALAEARERLHETLLDALRASLAVASPAVDPPVAEWHAHRPEDPGLWFDAGRPLPINEDGQAGSKAMTPGAHSYVRILPASWERPAHFGQGGRDHPHILGDTTGFSWGATRGGFLHYSGSLRGNRTSPLTNLVMQFRATGELWGVDPFVARRDEEHLFFADRAIKGFNDFIADNLPVLQRNGASGPFRVKVGVTALEGLRWLTDSRFGGRPQALDDRAEAEFTLDGVGEEERLLALEGAWGEIAAAFGLPQPGRDTLVRQIRGF